MHTSSEPKRQLNLQVNSLCFAVYIYFIVDFFMRFVARIPGYGSLRPTVLLVAVLTLLLFIQQGRLQDKTNDPIFKVVVGLVIYFLISLPFVQWPGSVVRENFREFVTAVVFLFFTALIVDSEKRLRIFLWVFVGLQVFRILEPLYLNVAYGYWGSSTHLGYGEFANRLSGAPADVINPNELGFVIATAIPFLHYLMWCGRNHIGKLIYLLLMPLMLYALILTMSRGAFLALIVVAWMVFKNSRRKFLLVLVGIGIVVSGWSTMSATQKDRYMSLLGGSDSAQAATAEGRITGMISEFRLGLQRPIFGHGLGTTPEAKTHYFGRRQASHNLYAELLIEIGVAGAVIFITFLVRIYKRFKINQEKLAACKLDPTHLYSRLNMALVAVFWMYVVYSSNYWGLSQYYWYLFGGICISFGRIIDAQLVECQTDG